MTSPSPGFFLQRRDGVEPASSWRGRRGWVVSRSLCRYRRFRLPEAERNNLKDFAALKAREWSPYSEIGFHVHLSSSAAGFGVWDGARVSEAMRRPGVRPSRVAT